MRTKRGCVPTVSARTMLRPTSTARLFASRSRSYRTSMWSEVNPIGATTWTAQSYTNGSSGFTNPDNGRIVGGGTATAALTRPPGACCVELLAAGAG